MSKITILIVEDEWIIANDIRKSLERLGYKVPAIVSTGEEAIKKARDIRPDLVLMDIVLDGKMDGIEAARKIHSLYDIPFIFLTAHSDKRILNRAKVTEPFGYLLKPFKSREVFIVIEIALYKYRIEKKIREAQEWLSTAFNSIYDGVITTDGEGRVTYMNPVALSITGWNLEEASGKHLMKVFNIVREGKDKGGEDIYTSVIKKGITSPPKNHVLIKKDKTRIYIDDSAAPIKDDRGKTIGSILTFRNITERRELEDRLKANEKLAALGRMAAGFSQELNAPLTDILKTAKKMLEHRSTQNKLDRKKIESIIEATDKSLRTSIGLLKFTTTIPYEKKEININKTLKKVIADIKRSSKQTKKKAEQFNFGNILIETSYGRGIPEIVGDVKQLKQVFHNILNNAYDAMNGKGKVFVSTSVKTYKKSGYIEIEFTDMGSGIPVEYIDRLFEPFFTTRSGGERAGLGLSVSHGIVRMFGGQIEAKSKKGKGASFFIRFPV